MPPLPFTLHFPLSTLHFPLSTFHISFYPLNAERLCVPFTLILPNLIFLERINIGVEIVDDRLNIMRQ